MIILTKTNKRLKTPIKMSQKMSQKKLKHNCLNDR